MLLPGKVLYKYMVSTSGDTFKCGSTIRTSHLKFLCKDFIVNITLISYHEVHIKGHGKQSHFVLQYFYLNDHPESGIHLFQYSDATYKYIII